MLYTRTRSGLGSNQGVDIPRFVPAASRLIVSNGGAECLKLWHSIGTLMNLD